MNEDQQSRYDALQIRIRGINEVINEGIAAQDFMQSSFFPIFKRTFEAEIKVYESETFKAAKSTLSNVSNYLGRIEGIKDFYNIVTERFLENMQSAVQTRDALQLELRELLDEVKQPPISTIDDPGGLT